MPWTDNDYPVSMKNLTAEVRDKAIEIANALLTEGYQEGRAIAIATAQAEKWAVRRDKPVAKPGDSGTTGQAIKLTANDDDRSPIHVIPNPHQDGWIAKQDEQRIAQGQDLEMSCTKFAKKLKNSKPRFTFTIRTVRLKKKKIIPPNAFTG